MHRRVSTLVAALAIGILPAFAADESNGERLARRWCASCHLVSPDQRQASTDASPFSSIAKMPAFDAHKLAYFLLEPHPLMPTMALSRRDAEDLAAYIAKLGR